MSWVCPIVGGAPMPPWHIALHLGLAAFVVVAGSIFLVGELRARLLGEAVDPTPVSDPL